MPSRLGARHYGVMLPDCATPRARATLPRQVIASAAKQSSPALAGLPRRLRLLAMTEEKLLKAGGGKR